MQLPMYHTLYTQETKDCQYPRRVYYFVLLTNERQYLCACPELGGSRYEILRFAHQPYFNGLPGNFMPLFAPINHHPTFTPSIFQGLAPTFVGGFSDSADQKPAYLICLLIYLEVNIGLALQDSYVALLL